MPKTRQEIPKEKRWNVEALYVSPEQWKEDFERVKGEEKGGQARWPDLAAYKDKLKQSPEAVAKFFKAYFDLERRLLKLHLYGHLRLDEDLGNDDLKQNYGRITSLLHDFQLEYSWVEPELLSLNEQQFQQLINDKALVDYRFYLEKIGRFRAHSLPQEQEALLALSGKALEVSYKAFGALNNADLVFEPAQDQEGNKRELTNATYGLYLRDSDRSLRKSAFENLHKGFDAHANTIAELLSGLVQSHLFYAKAKKFKDCREAALFAFRIDGAVYDNLIKTVHRNLPTLHEYLRLRKKLLGLSELHPYDLYVPLVEEVNSEMEYEEARKTVVDSVAPLGEEYAKALAKGLYEEGWVDPFENLRKRGGAYSSGCYDSMPYILMNYHGTLNDLLTLAHEAGHSMHSYLSHKHQPYVYGDYPIFVAEVASTFNEQLLLKLLKSRATSKRELAYLLNYEIEAIRTTIFRQTMFAEFELQIHRWAEEGTPLTPSLLKKAYLDLNRIYFGNEVVLDGGIEIEWARIPHFYANFYVYQYATGLSAALYLFEKTKTQEDAQRYLRFLSSGGSKFPLDLLEIAGADLKSGAPVDAAMRRFKALVEEFKKAIE